MPKALPLVERQSTAIVGIALPRATKQGNGLHHSAIGCTDLAGIARLIWPNKTAEHWAAEAGVQVRMAKYWLTGRVSDAAKISIARKILG